MMVMKHSIIPPQADRSVIRRPNMVLTDRHASIPAATCTAVRHKGARQGNYLSICFAALTLAACAATRTPYTADTFVVLTAAGPVKGIVRGFDGGLTNALTTRLVYRGVRETGHAAGWANLANLGPLRLEWEIETGGSFPPVSIVTVTLSGKRGVLASLLDRVSKPNANPDAVFIGAIGSLTYRLIIKAARGRNADPVS